MINILIVEDEEVVSIMLSKYIERYFKKNNFTNYCVEMAVNGLEAIAMMEFKQYVIIFLDVIMPKCNGFEVLDNIRIVKKDQYQPYISMTTAMGEKEDILSFKEKGATSYAIKPYSMDTIYMMLDKYVKPLFDNDQTQDTKDTEEIEDFEDFDDFTDFYDLDDEFEDEFDIDKNLMEENNKSHKKVTAVDFLKDYDDIGYMLEDLDEIDELLSELITYLDLETIKESKENINLVLNKYSTFLNGLSDFGELSSSLNLLNNSISDTDFKSLEEKKANYSIEFIRAILTDLSQWKEHVFMAQDAVDVFYINASILNSYIQLESLVKHEI